MRSRGTSEADGASHGSAAEGDRPNRRQYLIVVTLLVGLVIDGIDLGILSVAAPKILAEWHLAKASIGVALSAAPAGMAIGTVVGGRLGDALGRRSVLMASIATFALATLLCASVDNVTQLTALRLLCGLGLGAATPVAVALAAEWMPESRRGRVGAAMSMGGPLGAMLAGYVALLALPALGWRGTLVALAVVSVGFGLLAAIVVPESASFLRTRGRADRATALERRILASSSGDRSPPIAARTDRPARGVSHSLGLERFNVGVWLAFLTSSYTTYALATWLPVLLGGMGFGFEAAVRGLIFMTTMALLGTAAAGSITWRFGTRRVGLVTALAAAGLSVLFLFLAWARAQIAPDLLQPIVFALCAGLGLTQGTIAGALYGLVSVRYPVEIRATGVGVAMMVAKVAGVIAVLSGGWLLDLRSEAETILIATFAAASAGLLGSIVLIDDHLEARGALS